LYRLTIRNMIEEKGLTVDEALERCLIPGQDEHFEHFRLAAQELKEEVDFNPKLE